MFVSHDDWPPPPRWEPKRTPPPSPKVSARQERVILWVVGLNLLLLFVAPIAGGSLIHLFLALLQ